jgi:hypothetical protein
LIESSELLGNRGRRDVELCQAPAAIGHLFEKAAKGLQPSRRRRRNRQQSPHLSRAVAALVQHRLKAPVEPIGVSCDGSHHPPNVPFSLRRQ